MPFAILASARSSRMGVVALALVCGCKDDVLQVSSTAGSTGGGGGASPELDAGVDSGGGGGPTAPPVDAGVEPVLTGLGYLGPMVLDGNSLVVKSYEPTTHVSALLRAERGTGKVSTVLAAAPDVYLGGGLVADAQRFYFFAASAAAAGVDGIYAYPRAGGSQVLI